MGRPATLAPAHRLSPRLCHGGHEEGGHEVCHEGCCHEGCDEEGEEGEQRDEGHEGASHEEGHEEGQGDRGGLRAEEWGRFQKALAQQVLACRCGYSAGQGQGCFEAGGRMIVRSSLRVRSLVCWV